jgi:hypothetical protein
MKLKDFVGKIVKYYGNTTNNGVIEISEKIPSMTFELDGLMKELLKFDTFQDIELLFFDVIEKKINRISYPNDIYSRLRTILEKSAKTDFCVASENSDVALIHINNNNLNVFIRKCDVSLNFFNIVYFLIRFAEKFNNNCLIISKIKKINFTFGSLVMYDNNFKNTIK